MHTCGIWYGYVQISKTSNYKLSPWKNGWRKERGIMNLSMVEWIWERKQNGVPSWAFLAIIRSVTEIIGSVSWETHTVSQVVHVMGEWDLNKSITCLLSVRSTPCSDLTHHKYQVLIRVVFTHFAWFSMASSWRCSLFSFHLTKSCHVQMSVGTLHDTGLYLNGLAFKKLHDCKTSNFHNMKLCWLSQ